MDGKERRRSPRLSPETVRSLKSVGLNQDPEAKVIDISRHGALLESEARLPPNVRIVLRVVTVDGTMSLPGRVLRSSISGLKGIPRYQSAIVFEAPFPLISEYCDNQAADTPGVSKEAAAAEPAQTPAYGEETHSGATGSPDVSESFLEIIAVATQPRSELREMFERNAW